MDDVSPAMVVNDWVIHNLIYCSLDDPKSQMHMLAIKQPHESLLMLLRYRTNGHNASIFYCMQETVIVYITVVILLTTRKTVGLAGIHPMKIDRMSHIATTSVIEKQQYILTQVL